MKKRMLITAFFISLALIALTGCLSGEERQLLNESAKQAEQYLEDKYGENFTLSDSSYQIINEKTPIPFASSKMWFKFTDGTLVCHDPKGNHPHLFYDNKQSEEIENAIIDEILTPLFQKMGDIRFRSFIKSTEDAFSFNELFDDEYDDIYNGLSVYHEYYDGDIKSYLSKEDVIISSDKIYIVCNENEWQAPFQMFEEEMSEYFDLQNENVYWWLDLLAVTEEGYQKESYAYYCDGVLASLSWDCGKRQFIVPEQ